MFRTLSLPHNRIALHNIYFDGSKLLGHFLVNGGFQSSWDVSQIKQWKIWQSKKVISLQSFRQRVEFSCCSHPFQNLCHSIIFRLVQSIFLMICGFNIFIVRWYCSCCTQFSCEYFFLVEFWKTLPKKILWWIKFNSHMWTVWYNCQKTKKRKQSDIHSFTHSLTKAIRCRFIIKVGNTRLTRK